MKSAVMTKVAGLRVLATAALLFGMGFGASAFASDPFCASTCQELRADCVAQAGGGSTRHCTAAYRECMEGCGL